MDIDSSISIGFADTLLPQSSDSTLSTVKDSVKIDTLKKRKSDLNSPVKYTARDSIRYSVTGKEVFLYGDAQVLYEDIDLKADFIRLDQSKFELYAEGRKDSTGKAIGEPVFKQADKTYRSESMSYNFKSKKGKIKEVKTAEGEGYLQGKDIKKTPNDELFVRKGKYSTCNLDHPHFYINIDKAKVTKKRIITGPAYMVIEDVPLPLAVPFGFFPKSEKRASGILPIDVGEDRTLGFRLGGGYYFAVSDHINLALTGTAFTNGSYFANASSQYVKRYKYNGNIKFGYNNRKTGEQGTPEFQLDKTYFLEWYHNQDPKATRNSRFAANVRAGSGTFLRNTTNNINNIINNDLSSSITYSKSWSNTYNLTVGANHNQNINQKTTTLNLPNIAFNANRITPLAMLNKKSLKRHWYQEVTLSYIGKFDNRLATYDSLLFREESLKDIRNGIQHDIPVYVRFNVFKHLKINPNVNYTEKWAFSTIRKELVNKQIVIDTLYGFNSYRAYRGSIQFSTDQFIGMFTINKLGIVAIRHVMVPSIAYSYTPDFSKPYVRTVMDSAGKEQKYTIFDQFTYGAPDQGRSSNLNFSLGNTLGMKVKSKKDTLTGTKKIELLQQLNFSGAYNLLADSFQLSRIAVNAQTILFKKLNINFRGDYDPYTFDKTTGRNINQFEWAKNYRLARLSSANLTLSANLNPAKRTKKTSQNTNKEYKEQLEYINSNLDNYVDFSIPWNVNLSYNMNYNGDAPVSQNYYTQSVMVSGDVNVTTKWKIIFNTSYDIEAKKVIATGMEIIRDLHCWDLNFRWIPFGPNQSYLMTLKVRATILQDLKLTRRKDFFNTYY